MVSSTHDNGWVLRNSQLFYNRGEYFDHHKYLLGDSAYSASPIMAQALAQVQIASEHCIGILKGQFKCLRRNNIKLKDSPKEVKEVVDLIGACVVLYNLLIN